MVAVVFWAGYCVGSALTCRTDDWVWKPIRYWQLIQQLRNSPWTLLTGSEVQQTFRDAQAEVGPFLAGTTMVATAHSYGGPQAAITALYYMSYYSTPLRKIEGLHHGKNGIPMTTKKKERKTMTNGSAGSSAGTQRDTREHSPQTGLPALPHAPELVD